MSSDVKNNCLGPYLSANSYSLGKSGEVVIYDYSRS